jgi:uncharacterized SAM-dependent methyltransferase
MPEILWGAAFILPRSGAGRGQLPRRGAGRPVGTPKSLPCKFFYDARGSALFEAICEVPEYYLTRTEIGDPRNLCRRRSPRGSARNCRLVELGSGASRKVRLLLNALEAPLAYVPVDISRELLRDAAASIAADFPDLEVVAVCADYTRPFELPKLPGPPGKRVGFFPGSTIGNFEPEAVVAFLAHCGRLLGPGAEMLIGVDVKKDKAVLDAAYNDARAQRRVQPQPAAPHREGARQRYRGRRFRARRVLQPRRGAGGALYPQPQGAERGDRRPRFSFAAGEMIHTENSYKYAIPEFRALAARAGFAALDTWTDPTDRKFSVHYLPAGLMSMPSIALGRDGRHGSTRNRGRRRRSRLPHDVAGESRLVRSPVNADCLAAVGDLTRLDGGVEIDDRDRSAFAQSAMRPGTAHLDDADLSFETHVSSCFKLPHS